MSTGTRTNLKEVDLRLCIVDEPPLNLEPLFLKCLSPQHTERTGSMAVYADHLHCFGCGFHVSGRMESLAALLNIPLREAFRRARWYTVEGLDAYRERAAIEARKDPLPKSLANGYHGLLYGPRRERIQWFEDRGISQYWVDLCCLGHDGEKFSIPIWDQEHNLINVRFRLDPEYAVEPEPGERPAPKYSGMRGRNGTYFYPEWLFTPSMVEGWDWAVVCEGELDALRLWIEGIPAISPTNGASSVKQVVEFLKGFPQIQKVYLCTDQDAAGDKAAREFMQTAREQLGYVERVTWDSEHKDITELLQAGGCVSSAFLNDRLYP